MVSPMRHRLDEAQRVQPVVGQHRAGRGARRTGRPRPTAPSSRARCAGRTGEALAAIVVEVHVEVCRRRCRRRRARSSPRRRCGGAVSSESPICSSSKWRRNGCTPVSMHLGAAHVLAGHGRQHGGRALHRRALQVVRDGAQAAQLLAAAGAARAAVLEHRQRRAVAGGLGARIRGPARAGGRAARPAPAPCARRSPGSCVTSEPTRLPWPRAASASASSMSS